jgi:hypothetical protein
VPTASPLAHGPSGLLCAHGLIICCCLFTFLCCCLDSPISPCCCPIFAVVWAALHPSTLLLFAVPCWLPLHSLYCCWTALHPQPCTFICCCCWTALHPFAGCSLLLAVPFCCCWTALLSQPYLCFCCTHTTSLC